MRSRRNEHGLVPLGTVESVVLGFDGRVVVTELRVLGYRCEGCSSMVPGSVRSGKTRCCAVTPKPAMELLASSSIEAIGYDEEAGDLYVLFRRDRSLYVYHGVGPALYDQLLRAPSKGRFLNRWIVDMFPSRVR